MPQARGSLKNGPRAFLVGQPFASPGGVAIPDFSLARPDAGVGLKPGPPLTGMRHPTLTVDSRGVRPLLDRGLIERPVEAPAIPFPVLRSPPEVFRAQPAEGLGDAAAVELGIFGDQDHPYRRWLRNMAACQQLEGHLKRVCRKSPDCPRFGLEEHP